MSTLAILIDDNVVHTFDYDELQCTVKSTELTLTATRGPTGTVRDGLVDLPTGTGLEHLRSALTRLIGSDPLWGDQ